MRALRWACAILGVGILWALITSVWLVCFPVVLLVGGSAKLTRRLAHAVRDHWSRPRMKTGL